jgi:hypothetical protein
MMTKAVKEWTPVAPVAAEGVSTVDILALVAHATQGMRLEPEPPLPALPVTPAAATRLLAERCVDGWNATTPQEVTWLRRVFELAGFSAVAKEIFNQKKLLGAVDLRRLVLALPPSTRAGQVVWF